MIIHMSKLATPEDQKRVLSRITGAGFKYDVIKGATGVNVIGILGDLSQVSETYFEDLEGVDKVVRISKAYKLVSREYSSAPRVIDLGDDVRIGGDGDLAFMAGPCSLESEDQVPYVLDCNFSP